MPQQNKYIPVFTIKIGGLDVPTTFAAAVEELVVDTSLNMPGMFSIRLFDDSLEWVDNALLDIGKTVEIVVEIVAGYGNVRGTLITGEITALEPHFISTGGSYLVVRGYDKSHRLHRNTQTRTFLKTKDSDLVNRIAGEVGLSPQVDATSERYDFIMQYNQTNYEFLKSRADRIGYKFLAADGKLYFKKGEVTLGDGPELKYGETLMSFQPRMTVAHQAEKMQVKGWDSKQKKAIIGQGIPNGKMNPIGYGKTGGAVAQSSFGSASTVIVDRPVDTQDQATSLATGLSTDISLDFIQAEGICKGNPQIKPGYTVQISKVGTRFSGKYFVTSATHIYSEGDYETRFSISGRNPNTLSSLVIPQNGNGQEFGQVNGLATAIVTNLNDPENRGRVKVKYPWLGDDIESDWVRIAAPMAGKERGMLFLPEVDDEVLIAFEHGDIHHPYMVGALWSNTDKPPLTTSNAVASGKVTQRVIKSTAGHLVTLSDKNGEEKIEIKSKSGHIIVLDDKGGSENITIKDKTGSNSMVIDSAKNSMTIKVLGDFSVEATGKINMKGTGGMNLESTSNTVMKGMNVSVEGTVKSDLKGVQVGVNGSAMVTVQGGLVKIN